MKNIYLLLAVILITSCAAPKDTEINKNTESNELIPAFQEVVPFVSSKLDLSTDASFEGAIFACMLEGLSEDGIDLNSDLQVTHEILINLGWLKGNTGADYYEFLQTQASFDPQFESIPASVSVFKEYPNSGVRMSDCKITLVSERNEAYKTSKMFSLDNVQSGYKSEGGSVYLQLLEIYKNELSAEDLNQPYYKFSVQYIVYLYWVSIGATG